MTPTDSGATKWWDNAGDDVSRRLVVLIVVVTVLKALAAALFFREPIYWEDGIMAANFARTGSLFLVHYDVYNHTFQFPIYPGLVGWTFFLFGEHPQLACLMNIALTGTTAYVLLRLFDRLIDEVVPQFRSHPSRTWIVAVPVVGFLFHPFTSYYAMNNIHPFSLDMLMFYAPLLLILWYVDRGETTRDLVLLGLFFGLVLLTRTTLVIDMLLFLTLVARRSGWSTAFARAAVVGMIAFLVGVPWLVRNYQVDGLVGYTSTTGENIWKGVIENSEGSNYLTDGSDYRDTLTPDDRRVLASLTVPGQNDFFLQKYREIVTEHPGRAAWMFVLKLRNFFWFRPGIGQQYNSLMRTLMPLYLAMYIAVAAVALLSIVAIGRPTLVLWVLVAALGVFQSVFYVETRHRVVIEPLLMFLAAAAVSVLIDARRQREQRTQPLSESTL